MGKVVMGIGLSHSPLLALPALLPPPASIPLPRG